MSEYHIPVLLSESIDFLNINPSGTYVDATLGGGGHTREILSRLNNNGKLIVFDRDIDAINNAPNDERIIVVHNNYRFIYNYVQYYGIDGVDGILADLGVSSHQFDSPERGFSFRFDSELDMRMNARSNKDAAKIVNTYSLEDLTNILRTYGELNNAYKIAKSICDHREKNPINTTLELGNAIQNFVPAKFESKFLAKIYQALRIEVNGEMESLGHFLSSAEKSLKIGGRLSVITYHSLEDRMIKNFFRSGNINGQEEKDMYGNSKSNFNLINKKPILPSSQEIGVNKRARSAKLRVAEKVNNG